MLFAGIFQPTGNLHQRSLRGACSILAQRRDVEKADTHGMLS
jgi:hypothetical protein